MGAKLDKQYLEQMKGGKWRVTVKVPDAARDVIGRARLKRALGTDSLQEANRLKWPIVAEFQRQIAAALGKAPDPALDALALGYRAQLQGASEEEEAPDGRSYSQADLVDLEIAEEAEAMAGLPVGVNDQGQPIYDPAKMRSAERFMAIARGKRTPLRVPEDAFRKQKGANWQAKTWAKYDRVMILLEDWLEGRRGGASVEAVDRKAAGAFLADMQEGHGWTPKTVNGYLSCLRQYWKWMIKRGYAENSPWEGQQLETPRRAQENKERAFTTEEMRKLMGGDPVPYLGDLMRLAALTGARLGALVELRVRDCQDGVFLMPRQKSEQGARRVPIHSDLAALVARRCEGRAGDDWLFPEVPPVRPDESASKVRGDKAGKAFARYAEKVGVRDKVQGVRRSRVNFHSFRRWFITTAHEALAAGAVGFKETTISEVVGHKVEGMTFGVYKDAAPDVQLRACVEAVRLP